MLIAFLTSDLVFPSRVAGVARLLGAHLETAVSAESLTSKLTGDSSEPALVILDLNMPSLDVAALVAQIKGTANPPRGIIAFGPHVHEEWLAAAEKAGCDLVLTRGQFDAQMQPVIARFLGPVELSD
jgi:CheY-like chemotaxis protein